METAQFDSKISGMDLDFAPQLLKE